MKFACIFSQKAIVSNKIRNVYDVLAMDLGHFTVVGKNFYF